MSEMETERTTIIGNDGREIFVYPNGDRFYVDDIRAMLAGVEERREQSLQLDNLDELRARLAGLRAQREP